MGEFRERPSGNGEDSGLGPPPSIFQIRRREFHVPGGLFRWAAVIVSLIVLYSIASVAKDIYVDWLWFESVGQEDVYRTRISTQVWLFFAGASVLPCCSSARTSCSRYASRHPTMENFRSRLSPTETVPVGPFRSLAWLP